MRTLLLRRIVTELWARAMLIALASSALLVGIHLALGKPESGRDLADAWRALRRVLPELPSVVTYFAATLTLARLQREGSLLSLPASGIPLWRVGGWLLIGAIPLAIAAQVAELAPRANEAPAAPPERVVPLADGGFFFRAGDAHDRRAPAAALSVADERLLFGESPPPVPGSPPGQLQLRVREEWDLASAAPSAAVPERFRLWLGQSLLAPRSLIWGRERRAPSLAQLREWLAAEPARADLRFARDARLRSGLRVFVLLLLGFGAWLRPTPFGFARRSAVSCALAAAYMLAELWCAGLGAIGDVHPTLAAFGPSAAFAALGIWRWLRCDRLT